jgi:phage baseplate assembly protein W
MNPLRYRAWRFLHPDLDLPGEFAGLHLSPGGAVEMVAGNQAVRQALLLLLTTLPGERVMRPDYGCQLHRLVFSANDDTTAGLAIHYIRQAIEAWEPRVQILKLDAGPNPERPELLDITLEYQVRATRQIDQVVLSLNLAGEEE